MSYPTVEDFLVSIEGSIKILARDDLNTRNLIVLLIRRAWTNGKREHIKEQLEWNN